jgi:hypothetical protein
MWPAWGWETRLTGGKPSAVLPGRSTGTTGAGPSPRPTSDTSDTCYPGAADGARWGRPTLAPIAAGQPKPECRLAWRIL